MKTKLLKFPVAVLFLLAILSVKAQTKEIIITKNSGDSKTGSIAQKISLKPGENLGKIEIFDSCLMLLTDYSMSITIPLDKNYKMILPAGTKISVPKGIYNLENLTNHSVSFQIYEGVVCADL